jgi:xylitol oxidase
VGEELQSEYFVARADAVPALSAVRELAASIDPHLLVTELRTFAADRLWLSGAYERDVLAIHFTWKMDPAGVRGVLPAIEASLRPFHARPHWGKLHLFTAADIARVHPRLQDARRLFALTDPDRRFSNAHLERLGIR